MMSKMGVDSVSVSHASIKRCKDPFYRRPANSKSVLVMIMHHCTELKCVRRHWNQYDLQILPLRGRKGICCAEIMIYVNSRRDVRLSKGWRSEPMMINAPIPSARLCDQRWSSSVLLSMPPPWLSSALGMVFWCHSLLSMPFSNSHQIQIPPLLARAAHLLSSIPCDLSLWRPVLLPMMDSNDPAL